MIKILYPLVIFLTIDGVSTLPFPLLLPNHPIALLQVKMFASAIFLQVGKNC